MLSEEQKEVAHKFGVTEEQYARNVLAGSERLGRGHRVIAVLRDMDRLGWVVSVLARHLAEERMRKCGQVLGRRLESLLRGLGEGYRLLAVLAELNRDGWTIRVQSPERTVDIHIEPELVDGVVNSLNDRNMEKLRVRLLSELGREELIVNR